MNIFFIDDDTIFVALAGKLAERVPFPAKANVFTNGNAAIGFIEGHLEQTELLPDIILLDLRMPVMDGWSFLEAYTAMEPLIKKKAIIYILSSSISRHDMERAAQFRSVFGFISKPLDKERLCQVLYNANSVAPVKELPMFND